MPLFDWFDKLVTEHGSAAIQKTHIDLLRTQSQTLEKENVELKKRVAELEDLSRKLAAELQAKSVGEDFTKHRGVLFKRLSSGGYEESVYCPTCKTPMFSLMDATPYKCGKCRFIAGFNGEVFHDKVMLELKEKEG